MSIDKTQEKLWGNYIARKCLDAWCGDSVFSDFLPHLNKMIMDFAVPPGIKCIETCLEPSFPWENAVIAEPFELAGSYSNRELEQLSDVFKLFADPMRLRILLLLTENEELNVNALCNELQQSQPAVSHHLALLRERNLVDVRRDGKFNYYRVTGDEVGEQIGAFFNLTLGDAPNSLPEGRGLPHHDHRSAVVPAARA